MEKNKDSSGRELMHGSDSAFFDLALNRHLHRAHFSRRKAIESTAAQDAELSSRTNRLIRRTFGSGMRHAAQQIRLCSKSSGRFSECSGVDPSRIKRRTRSRGVLCSALRSNAAASGVSCYEHLPEGPAVHVILSYPSSSSQSKMIWFSVERLDTWSWASASWID